MTQANTAQDINKSSKACHDQAAKCHDQASNSHKEASKCCESNDLKGAEQHSKEAKSYATEALAKSEAIS
jgi:hypothetical protein